SAGSQSCCQAGGEGQAQAGQGCSHPGEEGGREGAGKSQGWIEWFFSCAPDGEGGESFERRCTSSAQQQWSGSAQQHQLSEA
ncbi:MAG: hypothetical protein ACO3FK_10855, partial [Vulcanococcus sp.]